uniref:Uncharacterized protein n=1 Tax=Arundo donax TaxID=35708 RepID=A0A0A9AF26_ARUDO
MFTISSPMDSAGEHELNWSQVLFNHRWETPNFIEAASSTALELAKMDLIL